jgi:hypothetical protein
MNLPDDLKAGDILLYSSNSLVDDLIEWKESGKVAHIEIYAGNATSWASRNVIGVGNEPWPFRADGLVEVRRPVQYFDIVKATNCFENKLKGLPYGLSDIGDNLGIKLKIRGVDCSHFAAILLEDSGCPQFAFDYPKQLVTPEHYRIVRENILIIKCNQ